MSVANRTRVAALQLNSSDRQEDNLSAVQYYAEQAAGLGVQLLVLPEMWLCIGNRSSMAAARQNADHSDALIALQKMAQQFSLWIVGGAMSWQLQSEELGCPEKTVSRCVVIDNAGAIVDHYDKMHLFDVDVGDNKKSYRESDYYQPGDRVVVVDSPFGKIGLSICYDLRFPELYRLMWQRGADIFVVPSAFTEKTGRAHWEILLRARAIENSCFVIAADQSGAHADGRRTWGHSMIVSSAGDILACEPQKTGLVMADISLAETETIRRNMPCHKHQKIVLS